MAEEKMAEENKIEPVQPSVPEEPKEEEVVEVPVDIYLFQSNVDIVLRALDKASKILEGSVAYEKFVVQLTQASDSIRGIDASVLQLHELDSVLGSTKFTNKKNVDTKIRKRVIEELSKHFKFTKINDAAIEEDVVVVEEPAAVLNPAKPIPAPAAVPVPTGSSTRKLGEAASREKLRREARAEALHEAGMPNNLTNLYETAFEQDNRIVKEEDGEILEDDVSPEEAAQIFQGSEDSQQAAKIQALKAKVQPTFLKSGPAPRRGNNKGIARSS